MISRGLFVEYKKLWCFDFDDTLVKTDSYIYVTNRFTEKRFKLTTGEFSVYRSKPGDTFDFTDFDYVKNPKEITKNADHLRKIVQRAGKDEIYILTARHNYRPIKNYLKNVGLDISKIRIVALGDSDPKKKSSWISDMIDDYGYNDIYFIDDSHENVGEMKKMLRNKDVRWKVVHNK